MPNFLSGGAAASDQIRQTKWSQTALGWPETWPQALKTFVGVILGSTQPMFVCWGARHTLIYNAAYAQILGKKHPAAMGQPFLEVWSEIAPELRPIVAQALEGAPVHMGDIMLKLERHGYLEEAHFAFSYTPIRSEQGCVEGFFCACTETTGQIMHERRLAFQRDTMHALYEQAPGFIATSHGSDHRFTFANAAYKRLVGRDHLVGLTVKEALPELTAQGVISLLDQVYETGEPFVATHLPMDLQSLHTGEPERHYLSFVYQPVRDNSGRVTGLFCEGYNATAEYLSARKLHLLEGQLAHAFRVNAMGTMMTTLAHELNQPLTAISNCSAALTRMLTPLEQSGVDIAKLLALIQESSQRAGAIIRNVRDFTKKGGSSKARFDLDDAIIECVRLVRAGGCVDVKIESNIPLKSSIVADRIQIQQVILNLLANACDAVASVSDRYVAIKVECRGDETVVSVVDSGPGLTREAQVDLFNWTDSFKDGGMGMGLSISRTIVEAHYGRIWLARSDRTGSEFCFSIPSTQSEC